MHFPELEALKQQDPTDQARVGLIEKLDRYLAGRKAGEEINITAALRATGGDRDALLRVLFLASQEGLVRIEYRVYCQVSGGLVHTRHHLGDIPSTWPCECTGKPRAFIAEDIKLAFFLKRA